MEFGNHKHQIQYLFPRLASAPQSATRSAFPAVTLTALTDSICIDLFAEMASPSEDGDASSSSDSMNTKETEDTSTVATVGSAADETHE